MCGADEADTVEAALGHALRDPFGTGSGFAAAAPAEEQPDAPVALWCELCGAGPEGPVASEEICFVITQRLQEGCSRGSRQQVE